MGIEETVAQLRREAADAQARHAGAEAAEAAAAVRADAAREDLLAEFGVSTVADAKAKLAALEQQLENEAAEVRRQLQLAGGP